MGEERPGDKGKPVFHQCFTGSVNSYRGLLPYLDGAGCRMGIWHTKKVVRVGLECWYGFWAEIIPGSLIGPRMIARWKKKKIPTKIVEKERIAHVFF